jgi:hypothetical protein
MLTLEPPPTKQNYARPERLSSELGVEQLFAVTDAKRIRNADSPAYNAARSTHCSGPPAAPQG